MREWPRLRDWIDADREGLRIHRGLNAAAREWEALGRDDGALYRGARLAEATEWNNTRHPHLNPTEHTFLEASQEARERDRLTRRRRIRLTGTAVAALGAAVIAIAVTALFADREHGIAASRDLAEQSASLVDSDPPLALALAREAIDRHDTAQAQDAFRQAVLADRMTAVAQASEGKTYVADPSPDGRGIVTAGQDGKVRLWRLGRVLAGRTLTTHGAPALSVAYSPNGKSVASVAYDGEVAVTPVSGGPRKVLLHLGGGEFGLSVDSAPGKLVVGTSAGAVWLIRTAAGAKPRVLGRHTTAKTRVYAVASNRDGTKVVSGGNDGRAYIWDVASGRSIALRPGATVWGTSFSPDGRRVATAGSDGRVRLWDARTGAADGQPLRVDDQPLASVRFAADGRRVVTTGDDGAVRVSDVRSGQLLSEMVGESAQYADFVPGSDTVASAGADGTLRTWTPLVVRTPRRSGTIPFFGPDGTRVVSGGDDGSVHLWDLAKGDRLLPGHSALSVTGFSPDGTQIVSVSHDSSVRLYDIGSGRSRELRFPRFRKFAVAMNEAGQIAVGGDHDAIVVQTADGANRFALRGHEGPVNALAFSPDGTQLASASDDGTARVWNLQTRRAHVIDADAEQVRSVSYSDDGTRLATAGADGTVRIWPADGGRPVVLVGHEGPVNSAEFDHRGDRIVSFGLDGTVRVWDTAGGETLVVLHRHEAGTASGAADFSPDGRSVVSAGRDGMRITACEVCGTFADVLRVAGSRAERRLSASERQRLVDRGR
jgi:WD40 repeat protein